VTIKKCHVLKAAQKATRGQHLTDFTVYGRDPHDVTVPQVNPGLRFFIEGSGFRAKSTKKLVGDEFKFVLNDYPDICKFAVGGSDLRTVKLRIYKVYQLH